MAWPGYCISSVLPKGRHRGKIISLFLVWRLRAQSRKSAKDVMAAAHEGCLGTVAKLHHLSALSEGVLPFACNDPLLGGKHPAYPMRIPRLGAHEIETPRETT